MPNVSGSFMGATEVIPGVYTYSNVSADQLPTPPPTPPLVYIGFGYGLEPLTPTTFTSSTGLLNALRGGPASTYVPAMTNPSSELPGAGQITFISVGGNTQSSANLVNSGGFCYWVVTERSAHSFHPCHSGRGLATSFGL